MIDTHAHLYAQAFDDDRALMLDRARTNGVQRIMLPNIDASSIDAMLQLELDSEGYCLAMMGLHPCSVKDTWESELAMVEQYLFSRSFVGVGETGLDLYWDRSTFELQVKSLLRQMQWAHELDLPVVLHARDSTAELIDVIRRHDHLISGGIFHCFSGDSSQAKEAVELGYYLGIGGPVTYKNTNFGDICKVVSLDHIVLETDAPYLPPVPHRGKRNESAYLPLVVEKLAAFYAVTPEEVIDQTTQNSYKVFKPIPD